MAPFQTIKCIGRGNQGEAWLLEDMATGEECVAKATTTFERTKRGYSKELRILKQLPRHPNIIRLLDTDENKMFMQGNVMCLQTMYEYCSKGTVEQYVERWYGRVPEDFLWQ